MTHATFLIVLEVTVDDAEDDDPRLWPFDDLLQPPEGESARHVRYVIGAKKDPS
jgi:hypothetical protein